MLAAVARLRPRVCFFALVSAIRRGNERERIKVSDGAIIAYLARVVWKTIDNMVILRHSAFSFL